MKRLAIIGAGDLGQLIAHHAINDNHYVVVGFFDDFEKIGTKKIGTPVIGKTTEVIELFKNDNFDCIMIGIGYKHMVFRKSIFELLDGIIPFGKIIHTSSFVDSTSILGNGIFILPNCTLDKNVKIGDNVLLNTATVIAHDSEIKAHTFLAPAVNVAGKVLINECCIVGIGSTIIDNIIVGSNIQIGGGAVVIKTITQSGLYAGIPATLKKLF
jgi:sugar O-acyltransferase (sialic acid O-acetyltransferase NeuD family)